MALSRSVMPSAFFVNGINLCRQLFAVSCWPLAIIRLLAVSHQPLASLHSSLFTCAALLFTFHSSLFTFRFSLFTFHLRSTTFHSPLFTRLPSGIKKSHYLVMFLCSVSILDVMRLCNLGFFIAKIRFIYIFLRYLSQTRFNSSIFYLILSEFLCLQLINGLHAVEHMLTKSVQRYE